MRLLATVGSQPSSWAATAQPPKQLRAKDPNQWAPLTIKMQTAASQHDSATFYLKGRPRTVSQASGSSKSRQQEYAVHHATGDVFHSMKRSCSCSSYGSVDSEPNHDKHLIVTRVPGIIRPFCSRFRLKPREAFMKLREVLFEVGK